MRRLVWLTLAGALASCKVSIPDDQTFRCEVDADCGGEGLVCRPSAAGKTCCRSADEVCDGLDNDCNGVVDDLSPTACYLGPAGTSGVGTCQNGHAACAS